MYIFSTPYLSAKAREEKQEKFELVYACNIGFKLLVSQAAKK